MTHAKNSRTELQTLIDNKLSRRRFMQSSLVLSLPLFVSGCAKTTHSAPAYSGFKPIPASSEDTVIVPEGYHWQTVVSWGDPIFPDGNAFKHHQPLEAQHKAFGDNNDGMHLFHLNNKYVLVCNNEFFNAKTLLPNGIRGQADVSRILDSVGISIVELTHSSSGWQVDINGASNRRITARTPFDISGPARGHPLLRTSFSEDGTTALGTWANCGNGKTPWGTYLSCEENFDLSFGTDDPQYLQTVMQHRYGVGDNKYGLSMHPFDARFDVVKEPNEANGHGYIVEIDPSDPTSTPKKRTALGRFKHENAALVINHDNRVVVYMGDDERGEFIYKFVSRDAYRADKPDPDILDNGTLYVARFHDNQQQTGEWIELTSNKNGLTEENGFSSQADICINTRTAASQVGATTMDRPEWVAVHPDKAEVYCTLTNNKDRGLKPNKGGDATPVGGPNPRLKNRYGQIVRWRPENSDHTHTNFSWDLYLLAGNPEVHEDAYAGSSNINAGNMFNSPDGLAFDARGKLWIQTDGKTNNRGDFKGMGNNQMLMGDPQSGEIKRFLTGPVGCEVTGLTWSPDSRTLFVGIQHPGSGKQASHFPDGDASTPRSSVIAIRKDDGGIIGS